MRKLIISVSIAAAAMILTSCASLYIPTGNNIPFLEEKHEAQIEVGTSTNSLYLMSAFAITDKWAVMANGTLSFYNFSNTYAMFPSSEGGYWSPGSDDKYAHSYGELAFGRYNLMNSKVFKLEAFAGGGYGYASDSHFKEVPKHDNKYFNVFIQGNIGHKHPFSRNRTLEVGGALRLAYTHYAETFHYTQSKTTKHLNGIHLEPTLFIKAGSEMVRGVFKLGICPTGIFGEDRFTAYVDDRYSTFFHASLGINIKIGGNKQKAER